MPQRYFNRLSIICLIITCLFLFTCKQESSNLIIDANKPNHIKTFNKAAFKQVHDKNLKINNDTTFLLITKPQKGQTSETWSGITFPYKEKIRFKKGKTLSFKIFVYDSLELLSKVEPLIAPQLHSYNYTISISEEQTNKWVDYHLNFSDASIQGTPKELYKVTFFIDYLEHLVEDKIILIDDIFLGTPKNFYLEKLSDFETPEQIFYPFGGSKCELITDPKNKNNTVLRYTKPVGNRQISKDASFICIPNDSNISITKKLKLNGLIEKPCEITIEAHGKRNDSDIILESKKRFHTKDVSNKRKAIEFDFPGFKDDNKTYKLKKLVVYIDKGVSLKERRQIMISPEIEHVNSNNSEKNTIDFNSIETVGGSIKRLIRENNEETEHILLKKNTDLPLSKIATTMVIFNQPIKVNENQKLTLNVNTLLPNLSELKIELLNDTILTSTDYSQSIQINSPDSLVRWLDIEYNYTIKEDTEFKSMLLSLDDNNVFDQPINLFLNKISYSIE